MNAIFTFFVVAAPLVLGDVVPLFFEQAAPTIAKHAIATTTRTVRFDANKHCLPSSTRPRSESRLSQTPKSCQPIDAFDQSTHGAA